MSQKSKRQRSCGIGGNDQNFRVCLWCPTGELPTGNPCFSRLVWIFKKKTGMGLTSLVNLQYIDRIVSTFAAKLKALRTEKKLGIKALARHLGISYTYISHLERGKTKPSDELIKKLASYFGVDEESLLLSAGRLPRDVEKILYEHPREVVMLLRESFAEYRKPSSNS